MLIIAVLLFSTAISQTPTKAVAQQSGSKSTSDLSDVNWDDEEETGNQSSKKSGDFSTANSDSTADETMKAADGGLSNESWEDEDSSETDTDESGGLQTLNQKDLEALESRERMIHITGFLLFVGYIMGGILTAFITRNRKIAVAYPPELLILLHTFWPLELILLPFLGKTVR
ncbi:MAG: hypothetical protein HOK67_26375 [Deltaproteobacteria bacterium]|nr:hypothetical protein [Deltaproteobacteria bacterium]MBT6503423.1 hypothetical protein [Deltaproteobacteria bacterium]MBT6611411.1 hypothetical protein [Deltaproteobacteria bacterium]MBT7155131.1 hypothetical protein [Deltaproteobacteria bacterium]